MLSRRHENRLPEDDLWWREFYEPFASDLESAWRHQVEQLLAPYAVPAGAWWAIRLDWAVDRARALDAAEQVSGEWH